MKVSIITPCYNSCKTINETYESICKQDYTNWEWLVTNDASTDSSLNILLDLSSRDSRVRVFHNETNIGAGASRNISLANATGKYIAFIDSDDLWKRNKLSRQIEFMQENKIAFCFTPFEIINKSGIYTKKIIDMNAPQQIDYFGMLSKKATFGCSTVMIDVDQIPHFRMSTLKTGQDYATWLTILKNGAKAYLLKECLTSYRIVEGSLSRNKFKKAMRQWEIYRCVEGLPILKAMFYFCFYAYRAVFRV